MLVRNSTPAPFNPCLIPNLKPSLRVASKQGAKPVQFTPESVRTVDNRAHLFDESQAPTASAFAGPRFCLLSPCGEDAGAAHAPLLIG